MAAGSEAGSTETLHRSWGESWEDFTQNTTMHGFRYIFDPTPFKTRRYLKNYIQTYEMCHKCYVRYLIVKLLVLLFIF